MIDTAGHHPLANNINVTYARLSFGRSNTVTVMPPNSRCSGRKDMAFEPFSCTLANTIRNVERLMLSNFGGETVFGCTALADQRRSTISPRPKCQHFQVRMRLSLFSVMNLLRTILGSDLHKVSYCELFKPYVPWLSFRVTSPRCHHS